METNDWQAFNLATEALRDIDRFAAAPATSRSALIDARRKLQIAAERDKGFLRARYYAAIVADILGHPKNAIDELTTLIDERPSFLDEATYNLAVSHYHMYSREHVEAAIDRFGDVERRSGDRTLRYMSGAGLVRAYAMMVLHLKESVAASQNFADLAIKTGTVLLERLAADLAIDDKTRGEIQWRVLNGRGVAKMFASDRPGQPAAARETLLADALQDFTDASSSSPDNWEIVCNVGSSHMRLGAITRAEGRDQEARGHFDSAERLLQDVLARLRPDYGFALYELGRVNRIQGNYALALDFFERARSIPDDERNVSVTTLDRQIELTLGAIDAFS